MQIYYFWKFACSSACSRRIPPFLSTVYMKLTTLRIRGNVLSARMSEYFHLAAFFLFHLFLAFFSFFALLFCRWLMAPLWVLCLCARPIRLNYFVFSLFSIWFLLSCEVVHCTMYSIYIHLNSLPVCCDDENDEALRRDWKERESYFVQKRRNRMTGGSALLLRSD